MSTLSMIGWAILAVPVFVIVAFVVLFLFGSALTSAVALARPSRREQLGTFGQVSAVGLIAIAIAVLGALLVAAGALT